MNDLTKSSCVQTRVINGMDSQVLFARSRPCRRSCVLRVSIADLSTGRTCMRFGSKYEKVLRDKLLPHGCELGRRGYPDFWVVTKGKRLFFVEVKRETCGGLTNHQKKVHALMRASNLPVFVSRCGELSEEILIFLSEQPTPPLDRLNECLRLEAELRRKRIRINQLEDEVNHLRKRRKYTTIPVQT